MNKSITAIVPVYNGEKYLADTLTSLLEQKEPLQQIIIIDDCSTDESLESIQDIIAQNTLIELHINDSNRGVSYCRNRGVDLANSEYVLLLDADDLIDENLVKLAQEQLTTNASDIVYSAYQQIDQAGKLIQGVSRFKAVFDSEMLGYEFVRNQIYLSGTIIKKTTFVECGGFNPDIHICEDWDLWIKIAQKGSFTYLNTPLVYVRRHDTNVSAKVDSVTVASKAILKQYSLNYIHSAIELRNLSVVQNNSDYVSILFFLDYWNEGKDILDKLFSSTKESISTKGSLSTTDSASMYFYRALFFINSADYQLAINDLNTAIELDSANAASWNNLGCCILLSLNNNLSYQPMEVEQFNHQSRECFIKALSLANNYMDASNNLLRLEKEAVSLDFQITSKPLRPVLLHYQPSDSTVQ